MCYPYLIDVIYWASTQLSNFPYTLWPNAEHHTCRKLIDLPVWRRILDLVSAPGQRSSPRLKPSPHSDTLKQSRLIQQSIRSLHPPPFAIWERPFSVTTQSCIIILILFLFIVIFMIKHWINISWYCDSGDELFISCQACSQIGVLPENQKWKINLSFNEKLICMIDHVPVSLCRCFPFILHVFDSKKTDTQIYTTP